MSRERRNAEIIWLGKYLLKEQLGHGGNGQVYLATHLSLHSCCAIKRVSKEQDSYSQTVKEARLLRALNHSGIPYLYDYEEDGQYGYLIEEYIPGKNLKNYCMDHEIELWEMIDIMVMLCEILSYLHEQKPPVFFLDLKPENVMYREGKVTLVDFGNAVRKGEEIPVSYGTVGYAAPEQYGVMPVGAESDIYGAGVLLKYLLNERDRQKKSGFRMEETRWRKGLTAEEKALWKIADRCMQFHPVKRYRSMKEVETRLLKLKKKRVGQVTLSGEEGAVKIAVASCQERMGATHAALWFCAWQNQRGRCTYYVDCSQSKHAEKVIAAIGSRRADGSYQYRNVKLLPYYLYGKNGCREEQKNISYILDCGCYWNMEEKDYDGSTVRCLVAGTNPWEREQLKMVLKERCFEEKPVVLFSFSEEEGVRKVEREMGIRQAVRIPYRPGIESVCEGGGDEEVWVEELLEYVYARDGPPSEHRRGRYKE